MNRPRLKLGLDASRSTLNEAECARIGRELAMIRERRGLTLDKVGAILLLASCQVSALENVQLRAFYGAEFYVAALKKYVVLMGLDVADVDRALIRASLEETPPAFTRGRKTIASSLAAMPKPSKRVVLGAAVLVSVVAGSLLFAAIRQRAALASSQVPRPEQQSEPALPGVPSDEAPATPEIADPAGAALTEIGPSAVIDALNGGPDRVQPTEALAITTAPAVGRVRVGQPTWVFVRYANGMTLERVLGRGEELTLAERPIYLAVGSANETVVEIDGQAIDNSRFIVNGALRVGSSQLAQLVARR